MRNGLIIAGVVVVVAIAVGAYMVDVEVTDEGTLPDVDVSVDGGTAPEFDVQTGDVDVGTDEVAVEVPTVDVETPEENEQTAEKN